MQSLRSFEALVFSVAGARLGLGVENVREVLPLVALQQVPEMPRILVGLLPLGSELIPVLRLELLLRLAAIPDDWRPETGLSNRIVVAQTNRGSLAWICGPDASLVRCTAGERVPLPPGHSLNNCAEWVLARKPPEPSIVLIEPSRLLLEEERVRLRQLQERAEERIAAFSIDHGTEG